MIFLIMTSTQPLIKLNMKPLWIIILIIICLCYLYNFISDVNVKL